MQQSLEPPVEQRLQAALATTKRMVQDLGRLDKARRANDRYYNAHEKRQSGKALTTEQEELLRERTYDFYSEEHQRIQFGRDSIATEVRPQLLRELWPLFKDLTYEYPATRRSLQKFRELVQTLPEESSEIPDLDDFVGELDSLLRNADGFVPKSDPATLTPKREKTEVSARQQSPSKRGPQPKMDKHRAIADAVERFLSGWKDHLDEIAQDLDNKQIALPDAWGKWQPPPRTWCRAIEYQRDRVIKKIDYTLKYLRPKPS